MGWVLIADFTREAYTKHPFEVMLYAMKHGYGELMDMAEKTALGLSPTMAFHSFSPQGYIAWVSEKRSMD